MSFQFGYPKQATLAILPKVSSFISLCGASWILVEVVASNPKRHSVYNRLLFCMSVFDFLAGMSYFASTWPIPRESPGVLWALGTEQSCTTQGFFNQLGIVPPLYNCSLSIYYLLVVKCGVSEESMARNVEFWMHLGSLAFGFATAIASLPLNLFNNADLWCWIAPLPSECTSRFGNDDETTCIRGYNAWIYRWAFFYAPLWASLLVVTIINIAVYQTVRKGEKEAISKHKEHHERHGQRTGNDPLHQIVHHKQKSVHGAPKHKNRISSVRLEGLPHHRRRKTHIKRPSFFGLDGFAIANSIDTGSGGGVVAKFVLPEKLVEKFTGSPVSSATNNSTESPPLSHRQQFQQGEKRKNSGLDPNSSVRYSEIDFVLETIEDYPSAARQYAAAYQYGTRVILYQSLAYTGAFYLVWLFPSINRIVQQSRENNSFVLLLLQSLFEPLQGLCNVLVYRFAFYLRLKQRNPHLTRWELFNYTWRWSFLGPPPSTLELRNQVERADTLGMTRPSSVFGPEHRDSSIVSESISRPISRPRAYLDLAEIAQSGGRRTSTDLGNLDDPVEYSESDSDAGSDDGHGVNVLTEDVFLDAQFHVNSMMGDLMVDYYDNPTEINGKLVVVKTEFPTFVSSFSQPSVVNPPSTRSRFPMTTQDSFTKDNVGGMIRAEIPLVDDKQ